MRDYKDYKVRKRGGKKDTAKRLIPKFLKIGAFLVGIAAIVFSLKYSYGELLRSSYFGLKDIVVTGEKRAKKDEIITLSGVRAGVNILALDLKEIGQKIESHPWVGKATVRRVLPRGLVIDVKEREPFAMLSVEKELFYLDRNGNPFKRLEEADEANYTVITGFRKDEVESDELVKDALMKTFDFMDTELSGWPKDLPVTMININKNQGITVLSGGIEVKVGFGDYKVKIGRLRRVLEDLRGKGKAGGYIDLTYTGQVVVR